MNIGIGEYKTIDDFVKSKLERFKDNGLSMETLFSLMFSEKSNIMYERSSGYRVESFTYDEIKHEILNKCTAADELLKDIPKGSIIGLSMDNSIEWIEMFWTVIITGYIPLLINLRLPQNVIEQTLEECQVRAVISDKRTYNVKTYFSHDIKCADREYESASFGDMIMVMSSGTTNSVKVCAYGAEELYHQIKGSYSIIKKCALIKKHYKNRIKLLTFLPFYHIFGLVAVYIWFSFFSRTFVELRNMSPETIVGTIQRHEVTHVFAVPLFWEKVHEQAEKTIVSRGEKTYNKFCKAMNIRDRLRDTDAGRLFSKVAFREVRENLFGESIIFMITGGASISSKTMRFFNNIGYHLANGYGMSETGITSVELSDKTSILDRCYIGDPLDGVEYSINEKSELLVKSRAAAKYILENGKKTIIAENCFNTHDLAEIVDGHYKLMGRMDDLVIGLSGENLNPSIIEPEFEMEDINGVCLLCEKGNNPVLVVSVNRFISSEKFGMIDTKVKNRLEELNLSKEIRKILYVSDRLIQGDEFKLNRLRLTKCLEENSFDIVSPYNSDEAVSDELAGKIRSFFAVALNMNEDDVHDSADFFLDLGGTSFDYFGMIGAMEKEFGISIPLQESSKLKTVIDFYDYFRKNL